MTCSDIFLEPLTWFVLTVFAFGSLLACRTLVGRICFTLAMPVVYSMLWLLASMAMGTLSTTIFYLAPDSLMSGLTIVFATAVCAGIFVLQIFAMSHDRKGGPQGYSIRMAGGRSRQLNAPMLQRIPTRKRWSG